PPKPRKSTEPNSGQIPLTGAAPSTRTRPRRGCKSSSPWRTPASSPRPGQDGLPIGASSATGRKRSARRIRTLWAWTPRFPRRRRRTSEHAGERAGEWRDVSPIRSYALGRTEFGPDRPRPEERASWRASRRMAAGTTSFVDVLRDAQRNRLLPSNFGNALQVLWH